MKRLTMTVEEVRRYLLEELDEGDRVELNYAFVHVPGRVVRVVGRTIQIEVESDVAPGIRRFDVERISKEMLELVHEPEDSEKIIITVVDEDRDSTPMGLL